MTPGASVTESTVHAFVKSEATLLAPMLVGLGSVTTVTASALTLIGLLGSAATLAAMLAS